MRHRRCHISKFHVSFAPRSLLCTPPPLSPRTHASGMSLLMDVGGPHESWSEKTVSSRSTVLLCVREIGKALSGLVCMKNMESSYVLGAMGIVRWYYPGTMTSANLSQGKKSCRHPLNTRQHADLLVAVGIFATYVSNLAASVEEPVQKHFDECNPGPSPFQPFLPAPLGIPRAPAPI